SVPSSAATKNELSGSVPQAGHSACQIPQKGDGGLLSVLGQMTGGNGDVKRVVCYDVVDDRMRNRIFKLLKDYGRRVQYSVFEVECDERAGFSCSFACST